MYNKLESSLVSLIRRPAIRDSVSASVSRVLCHENNVQTE
jgi:hypothetical protein